VVLTRTQEFEVTYEGENLQDLSLASNLARVNVDGVQPITNYAVALGPVDTITSKHYTFTHKNGNIYNLCCSDVHRIVANGEKVKLTERFIPLGKFLGKDRKLTLSQKILNQ
jgi:hypothetical protein